MRSITIVIIALLCATTSWAGFGIRHDTAANWALANPVLGVAEQACEMTMVSGTLQCTAQKLGDGVHRWTDLPYVNGAATSGVSSINGQTGAVTVTPTGIGAATATRSLSSTFFGIHYRDVATDIYYPQFPTTPFFDMGFGALRLWDTETTWYDLEPSRGVYSWGRLDAYVSFAQAHNMDIILTLGQPPLWATGGIRSAGGYTNHNGTPPTDNAYWTEYVTAVANRYRGRIKYYEIWNEPDLAFYWTGTAAQLATMTQLASTAVKAADPAARVIGASPSSTSGLSFFDTYLSTAAPYIDIVGVHLYVDPNQPETSIDAVQQYRATATKYGAGSLPLWNTESGYFSYKDIGSGTSYNQGNDVTAGYSGINHPMTDKQAAAYVLRQFLTAWASGVDRNYFYALDSTYSFIRLINVQTYLSSSSGNPSPNALTDAGTSVKNFIAWANGQHIESFTRNANGVYSLTVSGTNGRHWIVWTTDTSPSTVSIPTESGISKATAWDGTITYLTTPTVSVDYAPMILDGQNASYGLPSVIPAQTSGGQQTVVVGGLGHPTNASPAALNGTGVGMALNNNTPAVTGSFGGQATPFLQFQGQYWDGSQTQPYKVLLGADDNGSGTDSKFNVWMQRGGGSNTWNNILSLDVFGQLSTPVRFNTFGTGTTAVEGVRLGNDASATNSVNQSSPYQSYYGTGWATSYLGGSASSQYVAAGAMIAPESGTNKPVGVLKWGSNVGVTTPDFTQELMRMEWGDRLGLDFNKQALSSYHFKVTAADSYFHGNVHSDTGGAFIGSLTGNASTATQLYAAPTTCSAGQAATGVDQSGNAQGCFTPTGTGGSPSSLTLTGASTDSANGAASTPAMWFTGSPYTGGSASTTKPYLLLEDASTSTAWNTAGSYLGVNAKTGFTGNLIDLQLNGVSKWKVDSSGNTTVNGTVNSIGTSAPLQLNNYGTSLSTVIGVLLSSGTYTATSGTPTAVKIAPVYNQSSGSAANTDLLINRTETAVGSGTQRLISAGTGGGSYTEKFGVDNAGHVIAAGGSANHAICWKADGKTLGYCSVVVASDGTCGTCN